MIAAHKLDGSELCRIGLTSAERAYRALLKSGTLWDQHFNYAVKDASPIWGRHYYSNLCLWALPFGRAGVPLRPESAKTVGFLSAPKR